MSNFGNDKPLSKYLTDKKLKMSSFFGNKRRQRGQNFQIFKGLFLVRFCMFSEVCARLPKSKTSQFFSKYGKSYNNLDVKSCLKLNGR